MDAKICEAMDKMDEEKRKAMLENVNSLQGNLAEQNKTMRQLMAWCQEKIRRNHKLSLDLRRKFG